ncbi:unnamed protein product [Adineta steineri]|uniref:Uncharacterized protein n=1 Tax=Adineta steineri TaxID=433720 RepID=A0A820A5B8_9BILA|nr:unnamed protein product [Adineta steineri]CAF4184909.1 unnamed protein product [Adineta steineri]
MPRQRSKITQRKTKRKDILNIELDMKCSCSQSENNGFIQFARRYLQCQSSMPIRSIRSFIETILPYSKMIKVSIFDINNRLLKDSDRLYSLKHTCSSSNYIPLRFTLTNTITSLANCSCISPSMESNSSSLPTIIEQESINQILSTCAITQQTSGFSTNLSSLPLSDRSKTTQDFVNVLQPLPVDIGLDLNQEMIDRITTEFGEICPSLPTLKRHSDNQDYSSDHPLDLSMKKHSLSSQSKWIKT